MYEAVYQMIQNTPPTIDDQRAIFLAMLTLEAGYINTQSIAAWLRSAIERIETKNYTIQIGNIMNKIIRNIIIVALFTVGGGWLGIWLNNVTGNTKPPMQSLGALVWLTISRAFRIFLRAFGGDGWKDSGFGLNLLSGWKWYLVAILVYPLAALLTFGLASLFGIVTADGFAAQGFGAYLSVAGINVRRLADEKHLRGICLARLSHPTTRCGQSPPDVESLHRRRSCGGHGICRTIITFLTAPY